MSRLICFDICVGRHIALQGVKYRVIFVQGPMLRLKPHEGGDEVHISRNELAALMVLEKAEMLDELEDPQPDAVREVTNLSFLPLHRIMDWHAKVFILPQMMRYAGMSPRSGVFRAGYEKARALLDDWQTAIGIPKRKTWSCRTAYYGVRRWRSFRYALATVQTKGVQYCPWQTPAPFFEEAQRIFYDVVAAHSDWSVASIHKELNSRLSASSHSKTRS